jgi:3-phenylpropionate/trans-cinnamate dioxygenase ferredoxin reductase subunit
MFSFFAQKGPAVARINGCAIEVQTKETLLQAALRQGIDFPYSCRVGGCATCKCKLLEGKVKSLTEAGYILSDADLDQGYILACQSVPKGNVSIEVDLTRRPACRSVTGHVIAQEKLTHDITRLRVQLDDTLRYKAGQFAEISVAPLPGVSRSYSFATPAQPDAQVSFFVRRVPGGVFSSLINDTNIAGQRVTVEGPLGDFWLRPSEAPLLLVAGGSGLAPILALLQDAMAAEVSRPVTLLFGARKQRDLYALDDIAAIAREWRNTFRFVPVLSEAADDDSWSGARGLVTEKIFAMLEAGTHAYLCGPPSMIDSAIALLAKHGVAREHIRADRFTTRQDESVAVA